MPAIDNLINITITQNTQAVALDSFAIPLIIGKTDVGWTDRVHVYASPAGLLADGFTTTSPEYLAALSMFSNTVTPTTFMVGRRTSDTIANDIAAIVAENNSWYACMLASPNDADITALAPVIETMRKIFVTSTSTAAVAQSGSSDFVSTLKAQKLKRTAIIFTANANGITEAGWLGAVLPLTPGSVNWAYQTLAGVTPDVLTASQSATLFGVPLANLAGKNVNTYTEALSQPVMLMGQMVGGDFIDVVVGIDWLKSRLVSNVFAVFVSANKIPYTDAGATMLMLPVSTTLREGATNGLLDGEDTVLPIRVSADPVSSVSRNQRAARIAPTIRFQARLAGAYNSVGISGNISV